MNNLFGGIKTLNLNNMKQIKLRKGKNSVIQQLQRAYGGSWISVSVKNKSEWESNTGKKALLINGMVKVTHG